jgi:hypothetical protein
MLVIGGLGDMAFSLLPHTDRLDVVDIDPAQVGFIKHRIDLRIKQSKGQRFRRFFKSELRV